MFRHTNSHERDFLENCVSETLVIANHEQRQRLRMEARLFDLRRDSDRLLIRSQGRGWNRLASLFVLSSLYPTKYLGKSQKMLKKYQFSTFRPSNQSFCSIFLVLAAFSITTATVAEEPFDVAVRYTRGDLHQFSAQIEHRGEVIIDNAGEGEEAADVTLKGRRQNKLRAAIHW